MNNKKRKYDHSYSANATSCGSSYPGSSTQYSTYVSQDYASDSIPASSSRILGILDGTLKDAEKPKAKRVRKVKANEVPDSNYEDVEKPKPARKKKNSDAPLPEKRGAIFKKACPKNILDRVDRVISQRFFMIDRRRNGRELREEFSVLGSTGNVYTVIIDNRPSCNCPDAMKGNHCKHILFIFLKVLQVPQHSTHWYQKALLTSELDELFRDAPRAPSAVTNARVQDAYAQATGKTSSSQASSSTPNADSRHRIPDKNEEWDCPICYETLQGVPENALKWCEKCGNALHRECFEQWAKTKRGETLTCVYCRSAWVVSTPVGKSTGAARTTSEGYFNLSGVAGVSPVRDTSSYYHGPRRGQRYYGYQDYEDDYGC